MTNFDISYSNLLSLEFSNPSNALHRNPTETHLTFMGIYEKANPHFKSWDLIYKELRKTNNSIKLASISLYNNQTLQSEVKDFYKVNFWDKIKGDDIKAGKVSNLTFIFAVNVGVKTATKILQSIINSTPDGIFGKDTLNKLNSYNFKEFLIKYKAEQLNHYEKLIVKNKNLTIYKNGWINRVYVS